MFFWDGNLDRSSRFISIVLILVVLLILLWPNNSKLIEFCWFVHKSLWSSETKHTRSTATEIMSANFRSIFWYKLFFRTFINMSECWICPSEFPEIVVFIKLTLRLAFIRFIFVWMWAARSSSTFWASFPFNHLIREEFIVICRAIVSKVFSFLFLIVNHDFLSLTILV